MGDRLKGKRVLITQCTDYMGPAIESLFSAEGARVTAKPGPVPLGKQFEDYLSQVDEIDIVIANLAHDPCNTPVHAIDDANWQSLFDTMVHPLMYLIRHFGPVMADRGYGKVVAITSAAPLRGIPGSSAYCAARGAQNAFIRATGLEFASSNVQINAVGQNYVSNEAYYPDELVATERFQKHLQRKCADRSRRKSGGICGTSPISRVEQQRLYRWTGNTICRWLGNNHLIKHLGGTYSANLSSPTPTLLTLASASPLPKTLRSATSSRTWRFRLRKHDVDAPSWGRETR